MLDGVLLYAGVTLLTAICGVMGVYFTHPSILFKLYVSYSQYSCGLKVKYVQGEKIRYCYTEKNQARSDTSSILMVHGFSASKDMWPQLVKKLPRDLHCVCTDLLGHGETTLPPADLQLSYDGLVKHLNEFVCLMKLDHAPFHLIGTSMGGAVVGLYSAKYPEQVERVSMVCPAMKTPEDSEFAKHLRAIRMSGRSLDTCPIILLPRTTDDLQTMLNSCSYFKPKVPKQILKGILDIRKPKEEFYTRLFTAISNPEAVTSLERVMREIVSPSQVIWGENDELLNKSGVELLKKGLPNCQQIDVFPKCGHIVQVDRPGAFAKAVLQFRGELLQK